MTRLVRILAVAVLALAAATPAAAQFDVKKKVKSVTGAEKAKPAAAPAAADAGGGTLVLDDEVIERIIKGMRAAKAYREDAAKANTPYGRHLQAKAAYAEAQPKCEAGRASFSARLSADPKLQKKNEVYLERFLAAQEKQDTAAIRIWTDSVTALQDPACTVKDPPQPNDFHDQQQAVETGAAAAELEASDFDGRESGQAKDRAIAIIQDAPPPDVSPSEQQAVDKREKELKELMGLNPPPEARTPKPAPAAAVAPPPPAPTPTVDPAQQAAGECMAKNAQKNEKEIERLGEAAAAAANAGDVAKAMIYADSINRLQSAGCNQ
jgi:hypothetical protein